MNYSSILEMADSKVRAKVLLHCMKALRKETGRLNYLEIGTAFSTNEGLSTLLVGASIVETFNGNGEVVSIDIDAENIEKSRAIVAEMFPQALPNISWVEGNGVDVLSSVMGNDGKTMDLVFVDGSGDAVLNLLEFTFMLEHISHNGIIVIDDVEFMAETKYLARRDFGKAQLILPFLLIAETFSYYFDKHKTSKPNLKRLKEFAPDFFSELEASPSFKAFMDKIGKYEFVRLSGRLVLVPKPMFAKYFAPLSRDRALLEVKFEDLEGLL